MRAPYAGAFEHKDDPSLRKSCVSGKAAVRARLVVHSSFVGGLAEYLEHADSCFTLQIHSHLMPHTENRARAVFDAGCQAHGTDEGSSGNEHTNRRQRTDHYALSWPPAGTSVRASQCAGRTVAKSRRSSVATVVSPSRSATAIVAPSIASSRRSA